MVQGSIWVGSTDVESSGRGAGDGRVVYEGPGRHFTDEFKRQIVDLHNAGKPKRKITEEYELGKSSAERWVKPINATGSPRVARGGIILLPIFR